MSSRQVLVNNGIQERGIMEIFSKFWQIVVEVWKTGLYGISIDRILVAVLIFFGFILIRKKVSGFIIRRIAIFTRKTDTDIDDQIIEVLEKPFNLVPVILGLFFAIEYLNLSGSLAAAGGRIIRSLIVFAIFWSVVRLITPLSVLLEKFKDTFTPTLIDWSVKALRYVFMFIGAATILETWGIKIGPILAGLGLFGVAVALGAQDLFKNLISGLLIIAERRFKRGDWIKVNGVVEGTVESIGFRSTRVRRFDMSPVYVPNSALSDNSLINFSKMTHRRIYWMISVKYRTSIDQLKKIRNEIDTYIARSDEFADPPEVSRFVRIDRFSESSIDILIYCFTKSTVWGDWLEIKEKLAYKIKEIILAAGSDFAFPSRSIYVEPSTECLPESVSPPESI